MRRFILKKIVLLVFFRITHGFLPKRVFLPTGPNAYENVLESIFYKFFLKILL